MDRPRRVVQAGAASRDRLGNSAAVEPREANHDAHDDSGDDADDQGAIGGTTGGDHEGRHRRDRGGDLQSAPIGKAT